MAPPQRGYKVPGVGTGYNSGKFGDHSITGKLSDEFREKIHQKSWPTARKDPLHPRQSNRQQNYDETRNIKHPELNPEQFGVDPERYFYERDQG